MKAHGLLDSKVSTLSILLQEQFIQLLLSANYSTSCDNALVIRKESSSQQPEIVFEHLTTLTDFLTSRFPRTLLQDLTATLLPALTNDIITQFLPSRIPNSLIELSTFDVLLDTVMRFDQHLVRSGWARETSLWSWVSSASEVWFNNRLAIFLDQTRKISAQKHPKIIKIFHKNHDVPKIPPDQNKARKGNLNEEGIQSTIQPVKDEDEDETDGWGFDETEEQEAPIEVEATQSIDAGEVDSWDWDDEPEDRTSTTTDLSLGNVAYIVSVIPDELMDIIQNVLDEREQLQSQMLFLINLFSW
jgi:hypothetical protein